MKRLVPADTAIVMTSFPYSVPKWAYGYDLAKGREFLDSLLYTIDDPETPDGMAWIMDIEGMEKWYDEVADEEEHASYECPTIYEYLACEIGRYVTPIRMVI